MSRVASRGLGSAVRAYSEPLRVRPPRTGMRPGTPAGQVQPPPPNPTPPPPPPPDSPGAGWAARGGGTRPARRAGRSCIAT
jgi:hypothetical protein